MSRFASMKKADLQALANELSVSAEGTKNDIEKAIGDLLDSNPAKFMADSRFASYFSPRKRNPAARSTRQTSRDDSASVSDDDDNGAKRKHSPELDRVRNGEDSSDDEDEDESSEEDDDKWTWEDYKEVIIDKLEEIKDSVLEYNHLVQSKLSTVCTINSIGVGIEFVLLLTTLLPLEQSTHEWLWPVFKWTPRFERLIDCELFWTPFTVWFIFAVGIPLLTSHYFNFKAAQASGTNGRRKSKTSSKNKNLLFDPLVFSLTKLVLTYLLFHEKFTPLVGFCSCLSSTLHKTTPLLHASVGDVPIITGVIGTIVSLYVAVL